MLQKVLALLSPKSIINRGTRLAALPRTPILDRGRKSNPRWSHSIEVRSVESRRNGTHTDTRRAPA